MDLMRALKYIEDDVVGLGVTRGLVIYEENSFVLLCLLSAQNTG